MSMPGPTQRSTLRYGLCVVGIILLAVLLRWPAMTTGFTVDDYAQLGMMQGRYPAKRGPLELFTFSNGQPSEVQHLKDVGFFPWWSDPRLQLSMLRPLPSALMWLDRALFDTNAFAYHLHSLAWWSLLLVALALLFHQLLPPAVALLALTFFAFDETHSMVLGWLALRNEIVASLFAVLALWLHLRSAEKELEGARARTSRWPVALAFSLALCGGEYAIPFLGYFIAHVCSQRPGVRAALTRLSPVLAPTCAYLLVRSFGPFGAQGSEMYVDPMRDVGHFLRAALIRLPTLAGDLVLALQSDWWGWGYPHAGALVAWGASPAWILGLQPTWNWLWGLGVLSLWLGGLLVRRLAGGATESGGRAYPHAAWLGLGTLLALFPLLGAYPSSRLLVAPVIGFSALLASFVHQAFRRFRDGGLRPVPLLWGAAACVVAAYHVLVPSMHTHRETRMGAQLASITRRAILAAQVDEGRVQRQDVVLLGAVDPTTTIYVPLLRAFHGRPAPRSCHLLSAAIVPHRLERTDARSFELVRLHPYYTAGDLYAAAFNDHGVEAGQTMRAGPMEVTVLEAAEGLPVRTRHRFDVPLSDPSLVFLHQTTAGLTQLELPAVGESIPVPPAAPPLSFLGRD